FPNGAGTAHVYDVEPDTGTYQAYIFTASQPAGSPLAPQGVVELWDNLSGTVPLTVTIPNGGGGSLAVNSNTDAVFLMDNVNNLLYTINGPPLTTVGPPTFTPPAGALAPDTTSIMITGNAGDIILYTLDGTAPGFIVASTTECTSPCSVPVPSMTKLFTLNAIDVEGIAGSGVASSDAAATYTVPQPTETMLKLNPASTFGGFPVTATATITPTAGNTPTGTVAFTAVPQGSTSAVTTLCPTVTVSSDTASCSFTPTVEGGYTITATYSGDSFDAPSYGTAMLMVTTSGQPITPVSIPYASSYPSGVTPVALTTNNTGSAATYILNSDSSVSMVQNGGPLAAVCGPLAAFSGDHVTGGAIFFDPSTTPGTLYLAVAASNSTGGQGLGVSLVTETPSGSGKCTLGSSAQVVASGFVGKIELTVDPVQGNGYVLVTTGTSTPDSLYVYSTAGLTLLSQNTLDKSVTYGPLVPDSSTHRLYINDLGGSSNNPFGLIASPGFFVFDPSQSGQQLQHVAGWVPPGSASAAGQTLLSATALLVDGKGNLIIVNQNPVPANGTAKNPLPSLAAPLTILNTNQFSFFTNTVAATGTFCCSGAVDIEPGAAMSSISAATSYNAMSAADLDTVNGIVYGYTFDATASAFGQVSATSGSGALFSYNLSTGAQTALAGSLPLATVNFGSVPWSQITFDSPSRSLVLFGGSSSGAGSALAVSAPTCAGGPIPVVQVLGGGGITGSGPGVPAVNFTSGYIYDLENNSPGVTLDYIAQQANPCAAPPAPLTITTTSVSNGTLFQAYNSAATPTFTSTGGVPPVSWTVPPLELPSGMSLSLAGVLSGTPTQAGTFTFTVTATDSKGNTASAPFTLMVICTSGPMLSTATLNAVVGDMFSYSFMPSGGTTPYAFSLSSTPLDGLVLNPATGVLSGTPTLVENPPLAFTITVTDANGCAVTANDTLSVGAAPPPAPPISITESIHTADSLGSNSTLISAYVIPPITESIKTADALGSNSTLISAYVIPTIMEAVTTTDTVGVANTPTGSSVTVMPVDTTTGTTPATLTFSNVTQAGNTTLTTGTSGPAPPSGFAPGTPPVYYNLSTTASYSGMITVCVNYTGISFASGTPSLWHYSGGAWANITTSVNTATMVVCGTTTSLSPFALFQPVPPPCATNQTASLSIAYSGFSYSPVLKRWAQTLTLTNTTSSVIPGPMYLVLDNLSSNAAVYKPAGTTACAAPLGSPYVSVSAPLGAGASTKVSVQFTDPTNTGISYTPRVLAGPGSP
ncbi:MAG TPA: Ig domain-containing protein, partial [Terriglobales bacterium]|nr:Ig domain-containing protein [Terriglobales bacterium]